MPKNNWIVHRKSIGDCDRKVHYNNPKAIEISLRNERVTHRQNDRQTGGGQPHGKTDQNLEPPLSIKKGPVLN